MASIKERFDELDHYFIAFNSVSEKLSSRPDVCAIMFLDRWFPSLIDCDLICSAEHDEIWFDISGDQLNTLTEAQLRDLVCCGMRYDEEHDCLASFV